MDEVLLSNFLIDLESGPVPIGVIDGWLAKKIGSKTRTVLFSQYTLIKQRFKHSQITYDDYLLVPLILREGWAVIGRNGRSGTITFGLDQGIGRRCYKIVLKRTRDGSELYLLKF